MSDSKPLSNRRINMRTGYIADRVVHDRHDQTESEGNSDVRNGTPTHIVNNDRTGARKDKS